MEEYMYTLKVSSGPVVSLAGFSHELVKVEHEGKIIFVYFENNSYILAYAGVSLKFSFIDSRYGEHKSVCLETCLDFFNKYVEHIWHFFNTKTCGGFI